MSIEDIEKKFMAKLEKKNEQTRKDNAKKAKEFSEKLESYKNTEQLERHYLGEPLHKRGYKSEWS